MDHISSKKFCQESGDYVENFSVLLKNQIGLTGTQQLQIFRDNLADIKIHNNAALRVLAIGTCDGTKDIDIINQLTSKFGNILYVVVEPGKLRVQKFQDLVASKQGSGLWKGVTFEFHATTIEEYPGGIGKDGNEYKYHLIHAVHSAYFFSPSERVFLDLYRMLNNGGMLLYIMVAGPGEKLHQDLEKFNPAYICCGSAALQAIIRGRIPDVDMKISHRKCGIKADELFKDTKEGNMLLDFYTLTADFRKNASEDVVNKLLTCVKNNTYEVDGQLYLPDDQDEIIVMKA